MSSWKSRNCVLCFSRKTTNLRRSRICGIAECIQALCVPLFCISPRVLVVPLLRYSLGYAFFMAVKFGNRERNRKMKKYMIVALMASMAFAAEAYNLYSFSTTGSETIDGVTWQYCVSNNEARIISSSTLRSSFVGSGLQSSDGYRSDRYITYANWMSRLRSSAPKSASYCWWYSPYGESNYSSSWGICSYYYSAISSSTTGAVAVPNILGGCPVVSVDAYAFGYCTGLTHVTIPSGVREIGPGAFYHCTGLTTVIIPDIV